MRFDAMGTIKEVQAWFAARGIETFVEHDGPYRVHLTLPAGIPDALLSVAVLQGPHYDHGWSASRTMAVGPREIFPSLLQACEHAITLMP